MCIFVDLMINIEIAMYLILFTIKKLIKNVYSMESDLTLLSRPAPLLGRLRI